ncbi:MAG: glucokinase [Pyrinomonadaceae bacterium]|nr:glucokinase [Pyrinomonadaceae bacterium]
MIIAGDIGGTKTNIALFESDGRSIGTITTLESFPSSEYISLDAILDEFVAKHRPHLTHACFGIAGPVIGGRVDATNLAWAVSTEGLTGALGVKSAALINDLEAMAYGVETLTPAQLHTVNPGDSPPRHGNRALIAAGTGLGVAGIFWDGAHYHPMPSEGGHIDFAPRTALESDLLEWLTEKVGGHVSYERILSGPGLLNIYSFLLDKRFAGEMPELAMEIRAAEDPSAAISKSALAKESELAMEALDMFVEIYGAMAGNLALILKSVGGVFVGGGIAPKILEKMKDGAFLKTFLDKGRMKHLVASMPVHVILDNKTSLYGAARCALNQGRVD